MVYPAQVSGRSREDTIRKIAVDGETVLARQLTTEPMNRINPRYRRLTDGKVRVDPTPIPRLPSAGARNQTERITKQGIDEFVATVRVQVAK